MDMSVSFGKTLYKLAKVATNRIYSIQNKQIQIGNFIGIQHFGSTHCRTVFLRRMDSNQFQESRTIPSAVEKNIKGKKDFNQVAKSRCYPAIRLRRSVVAGRLFGRSIGFCRRRMGRTRPPSSRSKFVAQKRLPPTPSQSASFVEP